VSALTVGLRSRTGPSVVGAKTSGVVTPAI
jgi:hypothetical protein